MKENSKIFKISWTKKLWIYFLCLFHSATKGCGFFSIRVINSKKYHYVIFEFSSNDIWSSAVYTTSCTLSAERIYHIVFKSYVSARTTVNRCAENSLEKPKEISETDGLRASFCCCLNSQQMLPFVSPTVCWSHC